MFQTTQKKPVAEFSLLGGPRNGTVSRLKLGYFGRATGQWTLKFWSTQQTYSEITISMPKITLIDIDTAWRLLFFLRISDKLICPCWFQSHFTSGLRAAIFRLHGLLQCCLGKNNGLQNHGLQHLVMGQNHSIVSGLYLEIAGWWMCIPPQCGSFVGLDSSPTEKLWRQVSSSVYRILVLNYYRTDGLLVKQCHKPTMYKLMLYTSHKTVNIGICLLLLLSQHY